MTDLDSPVRDELERLSPLPSGRRADWNDVLNRSGVGRIHRSRTFLSRMHTYRLGVLAASLVIVLLGVAGTAIGLRSDFMDEQDRVDRQPWAAPEEKPTGDRVEVAGGSDWSFMAWRTDGGICVAYAAGTATNWGRSCGRLSGRSDDGLSSSDYLIATLITPSDAGDDHASIVGAVAPQVAYLKLELTDGRVLTATTTEAPADLKSEARLFWIRSSLEASLTAVRAYAFYGLDGTLLGRFPVG